MKKQTRNLRRHHRNRIINKKMRILKEIYQLEADFMPVSGTLNKGKVHCSCGMCASKWSKDGPKARVKFLLDEMLKDIKE
ncbi:hypothetical protein bcgnr5378_05900 [Bacillus cereus]|uniref:Uncharacterized protein n=1 Tax=Bacillus cereus TaxID=1396 RepID=A0A164LBJ8_BACCE|nr:hypothetical protein [Bacillus cereus]KZD55637.1 hypothetical protein B4088_5382 [Bacillus cereus]